MSYVFFFKQKTAYEMRISDWSSDVCSSDLLGLHADRATEFIDIATHHIHPDAATGQIGGRLGGGKSGLEYQFGNLVVGQAVCRRDQSALDRLLRYRVAIQAGNILDDLGCHCAPLLKGVRARGAGRSEA